MILTVTPNPCVDKTVFIDSLEPGMFNHAKGYSCVPGGKGTNASRAIKALGRPTKALVVVGGHTGADVVEMIGEQDGVDCIPVWVESPTRTITTVLEEPSLRQTAFFEPGSEITDEEAADLRETFREALSEVEVVTFNGTVSDPNINAIYRDLIPIAKASGVLTILDSHGPAFQLGLEAVPFMVKPNIAETEEVAGFPLDSDDARWRGIEFFHGQGVELVVLSLGAGGALVSHGEERLWVVPPSIQEVNPVGSGDCLLAGFAVGLLENMSIEEMAVLGVAAGTANAMTWDIGHFSLEDLETVAGRVEVRRL